MEIIEYLVLTERDVGDGWETYWSGLKQGATILTIKCSMHMVAS